VSAPLAHRRYMKLPCPSNRSVWTLVRVALLFLSVAAACGNTANAAPAPPQGAPASSAVATSPFAIADFDGDSQPDLATVQAGGSETRYWIRFQLSTGSRAAVGISGPAGGLEIASRDVNGDKILDLVVTTAWLRQPVAVLLNDGHGNFTLSSPARFSSAIWGTENSWDLGSAPLNVVAVAALSRSFSGDCEASKGDPTARQLPGLLISSSFHAPASSLSASFFGRAPPAFVHA
jgi:hypothetical protein